VARRVAQDPIPALTAPPPSLLEVAREWGRLGAIGFGGPPAHIALLRQLCVQRRGWLSAEEFERAIGASSLLPGPASTQLAIYCAWRTRGPLGALVGGLGFIVPGLILVIALGAAFLSASPPLWLRGAGAGAGAAVAAVAVRAGTDLAPALWARTPPSRRLRVLGYAAAGAVTAALAGQFVVVVLIACGAIELALRRGGRSLPRPAAGVHAWPLLGAVAASAGGLGALSWTALKVGALSFGGGFVIVPLIQRDAVHIYHWMSGSQFLNAVALGQVTPGPVVLTMAVIGYAAAGVGGALLAAVVAFAPSFVFVLAGAPRLGRLRTEGTPTWFIAGAAPAAVGAIVGAAVPLAEALKQGWQFGLLAAAAVALLALRRGVVITLVIAAVIGTIAVVAFGAPAPR
jgi:chromate transporter